MSFISEDVLSTEHVLLEPICKKREYGGYSVFKSKLFPGYYDGNLIFVNGVSEKNLVDWEVIFEQHFDQSIYKHKNFQFVTTIGNPDMLRQLKAKKYDCCYNSYMVTDDFQDFTVPDDLEIVKLIHHRLQQQPQKTRKAWKTFKKFIKKTEENDWYVKEGFRKKKYVTRSLGIEWFVLRKKKNKKIIASLGLFLHGGLARFQDVKTREKYQRKGYATLLVRHAVKYAFKKKRAEKVVVCAAALYHAVGLYEKCGFSHDFDLLCATKYP